MSASKSSSKGWFVLLFFIIAGALAYRFRPQPVPISPEAVRRPVLAVLIFDNLNEKPDMDFLANAFTRETIDKTGQLSSGNFDVIAYDSVVTYRKTRKTLHQIGRELGVDYVLEGGAGKDGDQVQLTARLTRFSDQAKLWSENYTRPFAASFQIQNEVIKKIASTLNLKVNPADLEAMNRASTENARARESYLRGVDQCASDVPGDLKKCIASFEAAIKADPKYARAHAALAVAELRAGGDPSVAEKHALQALAVTDAIPQAHIVLGKIKGDEQEFRKAIALNPSEANAFLEYAAFLLEKERPAEATTQVQRALDLDPFSIDATIMSGRSAIAGKFYDRGIAQLEKAVGMDRNNPDIRFYLGAGYLARNKHDDAIREFQRAISYGPGVPEYVAALGEAYVAAKRYEEAKAQLTELQQLAKKRHVNPALIDKLSKHIG